MIPRMPQNNPNMQQQQQQAGSYIQQQPRGQITSQVGQQVINHVSVSSMQQHQMEGPQRAIIQQQGQQNMRIITPQQMHRQQVQPPHQLQPQQHLPPQVQPQPQPQQPPMPQHQPIQQPNSSRQQQPQNQDQKELDPLTRAKNLLPLLRESLVHLMQVASQNFSTNLAVDEVKKSVDVTGTPRLEKSLEHFNMLSDQIDLNLRLVLEQNTQLINNHTLPPQFQNLNLKIDGNNTETYATCLAIIDSQRQYTRDLHDSFNKFGRTREEVLLQQKLKQQQQAMQQ